MNEIGERLRTLISEVTLSQPYYQNYQNATLKLLEINKLAP